MEAEGSKNRRWTWPIIIGTLIGAWIAWKAFWYLFGVLTFNFWLFDTWLGYIGLLLGMIVAAGFNWPPLRTGLAGFVVGLLLVTVINVLVPTPVPCLQNAKGWDVLRAYSISCEPAR